MIAVGPDPAVTPGTPGAQVHREAADGRNNGVD